jgi:O-antigen/teichoic acid export membrane protein
VGERWDDRDFFWEGLLLLKIEVLIIFFKLKQPNSFLRSVTTLTSGTVIAQSITIIASPVITRMYSPDNMGMLASYNAIISILGVIATGCYDQAIVLPENEDDTNAVAFLGVGIAIVFGFIVAMIFLFLGTPLRYILKLQEISRGWLHCIGFAVALIGIDAILNKLIIRSRHFKILAFTQITQQLGVNGIKISSALLGMGSGGLYFASISGYLIRVLQLFLSTKNRFLKNKKVPDLNKIQEMAERYKKFPLVNAWSVILNSASTQVPVIVITSMFSATVTGYYSLSHRILSLPMAFIGQSVAQVFLDRAARARNSPDELAKITVSIYKRLLLIGSVSMSVITFYGDILFPFVFGSEWVTAGKYAQWLSLWLVFVLSGSPLSSIYTILERQGEGLIINIIMFVSRIGVIIIARQMGFSDINMIALFSVLGAILYSGISFRILRLVHISVKEILKINIFITGIAFMFQFIISLFLRRVLWQLR